jgi:hypothetical protein
MEEMDKLIYNFQYIADKNEVSNLFSKEEEIILLTPCIEDISEENFQLLLKKYAVCDDYFNGQLLKEEMKKMISSVFENLMIKWYEELYELCYEEMEEIRLIEEEEKERNTKLQENWDEAFTLDHKFYFNRRSWELFRKQKPIILNKFKWTKIDENIKWRRLYKDGGIMNNYPYWKTLFKTKQIGTIHFFNKEISVLSNSEYYRSLLDHDFIENDFDLDLKLMERN